MYIKYDEKGIAYTYIETNYDLWYDIGKRKEGETS